MPNNPIIIIVTYNSEDYIRQCIESVIRFESVFQVVVVDNASSDGTLEILSELSGMHSNIVTICLDKNIGFGCAHNIVFSLFDAPYYALLNQDAWLLSDSFTVAINEISKDGTVAICGVPLIFPNGKGQSYAYPRSSWYKWLLQILGVRFVANIFLKNKVASSFLSRFPLFKEYVSRRDCDDRPVGSFSGGLRDVDWVCGAALVVSGRFVKSVGGFDVNIFLYGEDEDICISAHKSGYRVVAVDAQPIVHVFGWGANKFNEKVAGLKYRSLQYFIRKNIQSPMERFLMMLLLPFYVYGIFRVSRAFKKD